MKKGYSKILVNDFVVPNQGAVWPQSKVPHIPSTETSANGAQRPSTGNSWPVSGPAIARKTSTSRCMKARD